MACVDLALVTAFLTLVPLRANLPECRVDVTSQPNRAGERDHLWRHPQKGQRNTARSPQHRRGPTDRSPHHSARPWPAVDRGRPDADPLLALIRASALGVRDLAH